MVRRKRLRKSVLAIVMALCLLCGTVQTSTVVYATEPEETSSEMSSDEELEADEGASEYENVADDETGESENAQSEEIEELTQGEASNDTSQTEEESDGEEDSVKTGSEEDDSDLSDDGTDDADTVYNNVEVEQNSYSIMLLASSEDDDASEYSLEKGVNVISEGQSDKTFNVENEYALIIVGSEDESNPIVFSNCIFNLSGSKEAFGVEYDTSHLGKMLIMGYVQFDDCTFTAKGEGGIRRDEYEAGKGEYTVRDAGSYAAVCFFHCNAVLNNCDLSADGWDEVFLGLYEQSVVTFNRSTISSVNLKGDWTVGMFSDAVLYLNYSTMTSKYATLEGYCGQMWGEANAFYHNTYNNQYDAIYINNSTIDFSDNAGGGFALDDVIIHVTDSTIKVNNNGLHGSNSGYWDIKNSTIEMNGNGTDGLKCYGIQISNTDLECLHNGRAGLEIVKSYYDGVAYTSEWTEHTFTASEVDIRCNGEKYLAYTAGDTWLNGLTLTIDSCTSDACEGSAWLGAVGLTGSVVTTEGSTVVAYDLDANADDYLKSDTDETLASASLEVTDEHFLFLNPWMDTDYARGNITVSNNDADLFADDNVATDGTDYIINGDTAKIGKMTTAQLSHHNYDWDNEIFVSQATEENYGVVKYECTDVCADYTSNTTDHTYSFDCAGTYVYAPLVGLSFDGNGSKEEPVSNVPEDQTQIAYNGTGEKSSDPTRESAHPDAYTWKFTGWYTDEDCTDPFNFNTALTDNWTVVYAGWQKVTSVEGSKTWDDANNQDGKRPEYIVIRLLVGEKEVDSVTVSEEDNWTWAFTDLPYKTDNGEAISYSIKEDAVADYTTTYDGFDVTNSYTPGKTSVSVTKAWNDSNNQDGLRPSSVTVTLLKNGSATEQTVILSASNNWTASFTNLDQYTDGEENVYSVAEANVPSGYTAVISGDASTGFTITNTHTVTTTETEDPGDDSDTTTDTTASEETVSTVATEVVSAVTGDNAPIGIAILVAAVSEFTLLILIFLQMRKKRMK